MQNKGQKVAIIGGGSWATAIAKLLLQTNQDVIWWVRDESQAAHIRQFGHNPKYLTSAHLQITAENVTTDIRKAVKAATWVIMAVPAAFLPAALEGFSASDFEGKIVVSAIKGMIQGENLIMADYFKKYFNVTSDRFCVISGPCHAEEVAMEKLSYLTIASENADHANQFCQMIRGRFMRASPSDDIYGTEYGAVMKNIYALAAGIAHGIGYGDNFHAVLISNAIQEMERFVNAVHPINRDIKASAYLGDLLVTSYSQFSRNRTFGAMIGKGYSVIAAQLEMNMVAEGYYATKCIYELNKSYGVDLPICNAVYHTLYDKTAPHFEMMLLCGNLS